MTIGRLLWIIGLIALAIAIAALIEAWIKRDRPRRPLASYRPEPRKDRLNLREDEINISPPSRPEGAPMDRSRPKTYIRKKTDRNT